MNDIFSDVLDIFIVIYLDNILIYLDNMDDHKKHVKEVLKRLQENWWWGIFLKQFRIGGGYVCL